MNITLLAASKGKKKDGSGWLRLAYSTGKHNGEAVDRAGLKLASSFVADDAQQKVWEQVAAADLPAEAVLQIGTDNGKTIQVLGLEWNAMT